MTVTRARPGNIMYGVGVVVLVVVALYFLFTAVNGVGLADETATASVVGKAYQEAGQTYTTQIIGGRSYVRPQATPDAYLLQVTIDGREAMAQVDKTMFDSVEEGQQVEVVYQKRRLTGGIQIVRVSQ